VDTDRALPPPRPLALAGSHPLSCPRLTTSPPPELVAVVGGSREEEVEGEALESKSVLVYSSSTRWALTLREQWGWSVEEAS
jgi:hypothetical protein